MYLESLGDLSKIDSGFKDRWHQRRVDLKHIGNLGSKEPEKISNLSQPMQVPACLC